MKGIYVYAVILDGGVAARSKAQGVDFGTKVELYDFKDLKVAISYINENKLDKEEIEKKLQTDMKWVRKNVEAHHEVVLDFSKHQETIPMRFATIFKTKDSFERMLRNNYLAFKDLLFFLEGKQELGVKVFFQYEKAKHALWPAKDTTKKENLPQGMQWYKSKKQEIEFRDKLGGIIEERLQKLWRILDSFAVQSVLGKPLPIESEREKGQIIMSGAFLVRNKSRPKFTKAVENLSKNMQREGFYIEVSGPWPPYNFVNFNFAKV